MKKIKYTCLGCDANIDKNFTKENYYYGFEIGISKIYKCPYCDLGQANLLPSEDTLENYYKITATEDVVYGLGDDEIKKWKSPKEEDNIINFIISKLNLDKNANLNFLDVGAGNGLTLVHVNYYTKWNTVGLEPNKSKVDTLLKLDINVISNNFESYDFINQKFDIIYISQVLEHVHSPQNTLNKIYKLLNPGGVLWIDVPNCNEAYFRTRLSDSSPHLTFHTKKSLKNITEKVGFKTLSIGTFGEEIKKAISAKDYIHRYFKYHIGWVLKWSRLLKLYSKRKVISHQKVRIIESDMVGIFEQPVIYEKQFKNQNLYLLAMKI